ncbi:sodium:solute symporter family protein [Aquimarina aquimarini]|uniref:sodium:solute symporter family protein n=1 Tax=Aquimarina aquimarini TaxID=1191734 RepID=UPI000D54B350|nr:sodium:solute symporter family protein [Aquimarina aquimarini]
MNVITYTYLFVALTFAIYIFIAIRTRAKSTKDYYVANSGVHPILNGMATAADWMSASAFISLPGLIGFFGYGGSVYLLGATGGFVVLSLLIAPYLRKFGKYTVPDFVGDRYYSNKARFIAVICALFISFTYLAGQMRGVGIVFSRFLEVNINTGVFIGAAIVFFYAVLGGMKGITYTQIAQYIVLLTAFITPCIFISIMLTNQMIPSFGLGSTLNDGSGVYLLDKLDGLHQELGFSEYTTGGKSKIEMFAIIATMMIGTAGLPHVIVRFFTVPKVSDARKSGGYALFFIALMFLAIPAIGAFSKYILIETVSNQHYIDMPSWFKTWEEIGLITFTDLNQDGIIQYTNSNNNELFVDSDIIFLATSEMAKLPNWVIALVASGGLAAALSTAAGLLLVISTSIAHDLFKKQINHKLSEQQELMIARIASAFSIGVGIYFGIYPPSFVAETTTLAFSIAASAFFPIIFLGIFYKKMNSQGAIAGMLTGMIFSVSYIIYFKFLDADPETYLFGISPQGIGIVGMTLNFIVALSVVRFFPPPSQEIQLLVEDMRYPKGTNKPLNH